MLVFDDGPRRLLLVKSYLKCLIDLPYQSCRSNEKSANVAIYLLPPSLGGCAKPLGPIKVFLSPFSIQFQIARVEPRTPVVVVAVVAVVDPDVSMLMCS